MWFVLYIVRFYLNQEKWNEMLYWVHLILYRNLFKKTIWKIPYLNKFNLESASLYVISINNVKPQKYDLKF